MRITWIIKARTRRDLPENIRWIIAKRYEDYDAALDACRTLTAWGLKMSQLTVKANVEKGDER